MCLHDVYGIWISTVSHPGEGLLVANGPRWARSRRLLTPAFHFDIIKSYIPIYADAAKVMVVSTVGTK